MINSLQVSGVHIKLNSELELYVNKKIGGLDKYVSRKTRESLKAQVKIKESKAKDKANFVCEVIMHLPKEKITVQERSITAPAAIDLAEDTLKIRLKRYKERHTSNPRLHRRVMNRLKFR